MIGTVTAVVRTKLIVALFSLFLLGGGFYSLSSSGTPGITTTESYTIDIQDRATLGMVKKQLQVFTLGMAL
jgi:hypothetical protein